MKILYLVRLLQKNLAFSMSIEPTLPTKCRSFRKDNMMRMIMKIKYNYPINLLELDIVGFLFDAKTLKSLDDNEFSSI